MAHTAVYAPQGNSAASLIGRAFDRFYGALVAIAEQNPQVRQVQALMSLSDEELAKRGLKREEIARYVFADKFYM